MMEEVAMEVLKVLRTEASSEGGRGTVLSL